MNQLFTHGLSAIDPCHVLVEHPRPQCKRDSYINLNGLWQYAITSSKRCPKKFDGEILVPFSPEAFLSGVRKKLLPDQYLWYFRTFSVKCPKTGHLLLHFGAVDQFCIVFINRKLAGSHKGGYLPFTIDITPFLTEGENYLHVMVQDFSDMSYHSRGKQKLSPSDMFYTAQSGIWQTVWMEYVPRNYVRELLFTPDFDRGALRLYLSTKEKTGFNLIIQPPTLFGNTITPPFGTLRFSGTTNVEQVLELPEWKAWTPETPYLYPVFIETQTDQIESYFAMRKCDVQLDSKGTTRLFLNNRPYQQVGILDQGYWPDGLYTAPSDKALIFDIQTAKDLGFNMIRKHVKIESDRFYYHCDHLGMLVWQDLVNGGTSYRSWFITYLATLFNYLNVKVTDHHPILLSRRHKTGQKEFYDELEKTVHCLYNHPCIVCWVPFNEGWGQFDSKEAVKRLKKLDSSRLIDHASGWFDQGEGDIKSIHYYFFWLVFHPEERALALTEFGGYSCRIKDHSYSDHVYGYHRYHSFQSLSKAYQKLIHSTILPAVRDGIAATIYTQLYDVEEEVNGLLTYDREIYKIDPKIIKNLNEKLKDILK